MVKKKKTSKYKSPKSNNNEQPGSERLSIEAHHKFLENTVDCLLKVRSFSQLYQHGLLKFLTEPMLSEVLEILHKIDQKNSPYGSDMLEGNTAPALSERELDCIKWCAAGKTYWETATILGISERTVDFHMSSARRKTDTVTNAHCVAHALHKGFI